MESIYYSISWACHRRCVHCYEERFRPYRKHELGDVVEETRRVWPRVVENLPERMTFLDPETTGPDGEPIERRGRIILSGGEVLIDAVREVALYPLLDALREKYAGRGGVNVVVQTTGDLVTPKIISELIQRGVWMISMAGMDDFHVGMEGAKRDPLQQKIIGWMAEAGASRSGLQSQTRKWFEEDGPLYSFFGATPDAWIGRLWPRGRAWTNGLSTATMQDNFCNRWSGGLNFLNHRYAGSEVAVDAAGNVFPCCMKTKVPIGNLAEEPLIPMLESLAGHPVFEAINAGKPERMGITLGVDVEQFLARARSTQPKGGEYRNLCIGCDRMHEEVLAPVIAQLREERLNGRTQRIAAE